MKTVEPVRKELVVQASQERCFRMFTRGMNKWWPKDHHIGAAPLKEVIVEEHVGGRWYSKHEDGSESNTGKVLLWDPVERVVLTWQIKADWKYDPDFVTEVELRFEKLGEKTTRVKLEHRKLEAYGDKTDEMLTMFNSDGAWVRTLGAFAEVAQEEEV
jgi:uncharacterized protein YndB with AHSA1/START domain